MWLTDNVVVYKHIYHTLHSGKIYRYSKLKRVFGNYFQSLKVYNFPTVTETITATRLN